MDIHGGTRDYALVTVSVLRFGINTFGEPPWFPLLVNQPLPHTSGASLEHLKLCFNTWMKRSSEEGLQSKYFLMGIKR